tara:strand:- start:388 stop:603 length:216 start_codon:yes stop_codon:yes gene_type:complete
MKVGQLIDILNGIPNDLEVYLDTADSPFNKSLGSVAKERITGYVDVFDNAEIKTKTICVLRQSQFEATGGD